MNAINGEDVHDDGTAVPSGQCWQIAALLSDGGRNPGQLEDGLRAWGLRLGLFVPHLDRRGKGRELVRARRLHRSPGSVRASLVESLGWMSRAGWVAVDGEQFILTELGRRQADIALDAARRAMRRQQTLLTSERAACVTLVVQVALAALKVPAALLSGSVAQLNDAADTMLDLFSSVVAYIGLRLGRERAASVVLVVLMLSTAAFTLVEAVNRFAAPTTPVQGVFPTAVAIGSIGVYGLLYAFQRHVGLHNGSLALVTQSIDSRNHVIVAVGVAAGLLTAPLRLGLVDALVGLGVALLILRSALGLGVDIVRSRNGPTADLSRYRFWVAVWLQNRWRSMFREWLLYVVVHDGVRTEAELDARVRLALGRENGPLAREFGPLRAFDADALPASIAELRQRGWLTGSDRLEASAAGRRRLRRWLGSDGCGEAKASAASGE